MERERAERGYTVHELAALSGCTVRTLHHYDELGLVRAGRAANGYRRYGPAEVDRLQQVLLYREAEMPLADIKQLHARKERLDGLIASVEKTLASMEGDDPMKDEEKFEAFKQGLVDENEKKYGKEVRERWGDDAADASNAKLMGMTEEQYRATQELEREIRDALVAAMETGDPASEEAHHAADLHRQWLCRFWKDGTYSKAAHAGESVTISPGTLCACASCTASASVAACRISGWPG